MHKFFKQSKNATPGQSPQQPQQLGHALGQKPGALASSAETSPGSASRRPRPSLGGSAGNGSNGSGSGGSGNNRNGGEPRFEDILMDQVNSLKRLIKEMEREHARRTETLIEALSEKAEENIQLLNELEALKAKVKEDNEATANTAGRQYPDSDRPFSPRPLVVSPAPEPQKQLQQQQQSQEKPKAAEVKIVEGAAITETAKKDEQLPPPEKECIPEDNASKALESGVDDALKKLRKELEEERQKTKMLGMSVQEYERRIVTLECKMQDSLAREQEKRFLAESNTRKYEQKIRNLEHRVSDLENQTVDGEEEKEEEEDDDDDENEDEDEGEKKEKCENEKKDEEMK